jgi:tagaturonate reductase
VCSSDLLYHRFEIFGNSPNKGLVILPCELIDDNGKELKKCVLKYADSWNLGEDFIHWIETDNIFCSTLVDRIVTGFPTEEAENLFKELGYTDELLNTSEPFALWVIEAPTFLRDEFPASYCGLPVLIVNDHTPYKTRKVRILNGAHTSFVMGAYLAGQRIVRDCMNDEVISAFMDKVIFQEIIPTLDLPREELEDFASSVKERFNNPFIDHELIAITLNSTAKWRARLLPSLKEYLNKIGQIPNCISASLAFYIAFYSGHTLTEEGLIATGPDGEYMIKDDVAVLKFFYDRKDLSPTNLVHQVCSNESFWGEDLSKLPGFEDKVVEYLTSIKKNSSYETMRGLL